MPTEPTYTINEAAALTGLHRNTIRTRVKLGQLEATVQPGKFGDEYRISHSALIEAGLISPTGPLGENGPSAPHEDERPVLRAEQAEEADEPGDGGGVHPGAAVAALSELYQRHEQAMFRLGYLQGELERLKALADTAESLREDNQTQKAEVETLKRALEEQARREAEAEALRRQNEALQEELERERMRLREMDALREDLEQLKVLAEKKRPWWQIWK